MTSHEDLREIAKAFGDDLINGLSAGHFIELAEDEKIQIGFRAMPGLERKIVELPVRWGVVAGLDIREWTKRNPSGQLIVAAIMNSCILHALRILQTEGLFTKEDPLLVVPTGDGAYVVFDAGADEEESSKKEKEERKIVEELNEQSIKERQERLQKLQQATEDRLEAIQKALSFVLIVNAFFVEQNARGRSCAWGIQDEETSVLPIYPRFALTLDRMLLCIDVKEKLNAIGPAMVTCGRILSSDHGNHFLVHDWLMHECDLYGGLARVASCAGLGDWDAHFHCAELPEKQIKSGRFRYADVFGHYSDGPLLRLHGIRSVKPMEYQIGSHDILRLGS